MTASSAISVTMKVRGNLKMKIAALQPVQLPRLIMSNSCLVRWILNSGRIDSTGVLGPKTETVSGKELTHFFSMFTSDKLHY
jgi:hypothetical protein